MKTPLKKLLFLGLSSLSLSLIVWGATSVSAKNKTAKIDAIATDFFQQYPTTEQNESANTLESISAELGLNLRAHSTERDLPTPKEAADFQTIQQTVQDYFVVQKLKEQGPLEPIPTRIQTYLSDNQATLTELQTRLQSQSRPVWHFDANLYGDLQYTLPPYMGLIDLHRLLLLKAATHAQQNQPEQMLAALDAAQRVLDIPVQRPDMISYLVSLLAVDNAIAITRHLDGLPPRVSDSLLAVDYQQFGVESLRFDNRSFFKGIKRMLDDPDYSANLSDS